MGIDDKRKDACKIIDAHLLKELRDYLLEPLNYQGIGRWGALLLANDVVGRVCQLGTQLTCISCGDPAAKRPLSTRTMLLYMIYAWHVILNAGVYTTLNQKKRKQGSDWGMQGRRG